MKKMHIYVVAIGLTVIGLGLFFYKALILDFPLVPETKSYIWEIEARVTFMAKNEPVKVSLFIPDNPRNFTILNENFISRGYGLSTAREDGNRKVTWSIRKDKGDQSLYYRASVRRVDRKDKKGPTKPPEIESPEFQDAALAAVQSIIAELREKSADIDTMVSQLLKRLNSSKPDDNLSILLEKEALSPKKMNLAVKLLAFAGIPARPVHGIRIEDIRRDSPTLHWLEVYDEKEWKSYNPNTGEMGLPRDYLTWWRGKDPMVKLKGGKNLKVNLSVNYNLEEAIRAAIGLGKIKRRLLLEYSLFSLPIQTQAVYHILLLVPIGTFILVILRNVVGVKTFGTFMPVLIGLSFRETELAWGLIMFALLVGLGLSIRLYLENLKLLVVPRLASVLIVVVLLMAGISLLTHKLGLDRGLSVALFPMVILTMTIERMSIVWEEQGSPEALKQGLGSLLVATIAYLVMTIKYVDHLIFVFPELILIILAGTILLGRYSGFRLLELRRFKALTESDI
jgi:hypothetical protein